MSAKNGSVGVVRVKHRPFRPTSGQARNTPLARGGLWATHRAPHRPSQAQQSMRDSHWPR